MPQALVVEDDVTTHTLFLTIARRCGYETASAYDGAEAIEHVRNGSPDVIVLDLLMPKVNGFEVLRELRCLAPDLLPKTVVVTAAAEWTLGECEEMRLVRAVVSKPLELDRMVSLLLCLKPEATPRLVGSELYL